MIRQAIEVWADYFWRMVKVSRPSSKFFLDVFQHENGESMSTPKRFLRFFFVKTTMGIDGSKGFE